MAFSISEEYLSNKIKVTHYDKLFSSYQSIQLFGSQGSNIAEANSHINSCLSTSKSRLEGLLLLHRVIDQCSSQVLIENCVSWSCALLQILQSYNCPLVYQTTCAVMCRLLHHASSSSEVSHETGRSIIPQLLPLLLSADSQWHLSALDCLEATLKYFPGPCGPSKNKLTQKLKCCLLKSCVEDMEMQALCICYALLPFIGGGGTGGIKWAESWSTQTAGLVRVLHELLDALYGNLVTDPKEHIRPSATFNLAIPNDSGPNHMLYLVNLFSVFTKALATTLNTETKVSVAVPIEAILDVVCRAMAVSHKFLMTRPTREHMLLSTILPTVHQEAMTILCSLINFVGCSVISNSQTVNKLFVQTLNQTQTLAKDDESYQRKFCDLRTAVYEATRDWLVVTGTSSSMETVASDIVAHALEDARAHSGSVLINFSSDQKNREARHTLEKKKSKKSTPEARDGLQSSWQQKIDGGANVNLCTAALQAVSQLVMKCGSLLNPSCHKVLQEFAVPLLFRLLQGYNQAPHPYDNPSCRKALYCLLHSLVLVPSPKCPSPVQVAVRVFSLGQTVENNLEVKAYCQEALLVCQTLIHPRVTPLIPVVFDQQPVRENSSLQEVSLVENASHQQKSSVSLSDVEMGTTEENSDHRDSDMADHDTRELNVVDVVELLSDDSDDVMVTGEDPASDDTRNISVQNVQTIRSEENDFVMPGNEVASHQVDKGIVSDEDLGSVRADDPQHTAEPTVTDSTPTDQSAEPTVTDSTPTDQPAVRLLGVKHKLDNPQSQDIGDQPGCKRVVDETHLMIETFIDAGPDSE